MVSEALICIPGKMFVPKRQSSKVGASVTIQGHWKFILHVFVICLHRKSIRLVTVKYNSQTTEWNQNALLHSEWAIFNHHRKRKGSLNSYIDETKHTWSVKNFDTSRLQMRITRIIDKQMGFLVDRVDIAWIGEKDWFSQNSKANTLHQSFYFGRENTFQ